MSTRQGAGHVRPNLEQIAANIVAEVTPRILAALAPLFVPVNYDQRNAPQGKRRYLKLVTEFESEGGEVTRDARRVVVDAAAWDAWIRRRGARRKVVNLPIAPANDALDVQLGLVSR